MSFDILHRLLTDFLGTDVQLAMGMTDVDDKIIRRHACGADCPPVWPYARCCSAPQGK